MDKKVIVTINGQYRTRAAVEAAPTSDFIPLQSTGRRMCAFHPIPTKYLEILEAQELSDLMVHIDDAIELTKHGVDDDVLNYMHAASGTLDAIDKVSLSRGCQSTQPRSRKQQSSSGKKGSFQAKFESMSMKDSIYGSEDDTSTDKYLLNYGRKTKGNTHSKHSATHATEDLCARRAFEHEPTKRRGSTSYPKVQSHHAFESMVPRITSPFSKSYRESRTDYPPSPRAQVQDFIDRNPPRKVLQSHTSRTTQKLSTLYTDVPEPVGKSFGTFPFGPFNPALVEKVIRKASRAQMLALCRGYPFTLKPRRNPLGRELTDELLDQGSIASMEIVFSEHNIERLFAELPDRCQFQRPWWDERYAGCRM